MKILVYTTLYPNTLDANLGIFIQNRLLRFTGQFGHTMQVVAPVPYFPGLPAFPRWYRFRQVPSVEERHGVTVFHPRYLVTPRLGMTLYGLNMFLGTWRTVRQIQRRFDFDLVDAHFLFPDAFAAVLLGRALRKPVVVSARGSDVHQYGRLRTIRPLLRFVLRRASAVISVSQSLKEQIVGLGIPELKVHVIGNGVDLRDFFPKDRLTTRHRLKLPANRTILLSVARLAPVKGIHHLIDAIALLRWERPDLLLLVVGATSDAVYAARLEKQVSELGLSDWVRFVEAQEHHQLCDWYNSCDLFCLGSEREGWPNVLLEAMACGKPVIASRVGGIPEVVNSQELGILAERPRGAELAAAIRQGLRTGWEPERIVARAREVTWERVSAQQQAVFEQVVGNPASDCVSRPVESC